MDCSVTAAQETSYRPHTFGGILQYAAERAARLEQLRAATPPAVLAAIEQAAAAQFDRDHTSPFGRDLLRRIAIDNAVAAYWQIPSFAEWKATQDSQEGNGDETP